MAEALQIAERRSLQLATVMARKGVEAGAVGERLGLKAPVGPNTAQAYGLTLIGTGPGVWLAVTEDAKTDWAERLGQTLQGVASVSEQSGGYVVLRMTGAGAANLLQKGAFIDLHPQAFPVGSAAVTVIAHIGVILWKVDEAPSFDVAVFRSLAGSFHDWIAAAAPA